MFGPKGAEVTGGWRKLHNEEEFHNYSSLNIREIKSRKIWARHIACMAELRNACKSLVGKPEGKRLLGRPRH
jgi:hypothetical protein